MSSNEPIDPRDVDPLERKRTMESAAAEPAAESFVDRLRGATADADDDDVEVDIWEGGYCGKAMFGKYLVMSIISLVIIVLMVMFDNLHQENRWLYVLLAIAVMWAYLGLMLLYRKMNVHYRLTTQRFIHRVGILTQVSDRIEVIDIDDVTFHQGFIERMVDVGSIKIESSDKSHPELWLLGIENVKIVANQIDDLRRNERRRRGIHVESV